MSELGPGPIEGSYWVQERFAAGAYPRAWPRFRLQNKLRALLHAGTTFFLDLTEPGEGRLRPYESLLYREAQAMEGRVRYTRVPVPDFDCPTESEMRQILDLIDGALAMGEGVYLHCHAGIGRTGTVVGCFLVRRGWGGQEALDKIAELRRGLESASQPSPITPGQRGLVLDWATCDSPKR
jgi:hypothetical protein